MYSFCFHLSENPFLGNHSVWSRSFLTARIRSVIIVHASEQQYRVRVLLLTCLLHPILLQAQINSIFSLISQKARCLKALSVPFFIPLQKCIYHLASFRQSGHRHRILIVRSLPLHENRQLGSWVRPIFFFKTQQWEGIVNETFIRHQRV